ncbi:hypothetical protein [Mesorhizobium sp. GR13]|uniref:SMODS domain-containing nucleotidyltransferase n=1 Tax=Mesorhizobium sp. GR13 TaxID=2562308 RepID=UPI0010BFA3C6|nr:hypothetical protein [Mesorhizobium sp. GR13]
MELRPQFNQFLQDIRPTERHKDEWRTGSGTLRTRLRADAALSPLIVSSFLQGSVRRSTAVRPTGGKRSDVDVVIVTTIDYSKEQPNVAMKRFEPFLEKHYSGKWRRQDRSFGIELSYVDLDLVVTALPSDPEDRQKLMEIYRSNAVETSATLEERSDWNLSKDWSPFVNILSESAHAMTDAIPDAEWKPHPLMLPDRAVKDWGPTHPLAQIKWAADKNRATNGHYINVVRALKWWRHTNSESLPKYPKGYPLEHMIGYVLPDGILSMAQGVTLAFEKLRDTFSPYARMGTVPYLPDHGVPSHNVLKRLSLEDFTAFVAAVTAAADNARKALDSQDAGESGRLWQKLFGTSFPLPGPTGGDRPKGFAQPTSSAQPKTDRFA